MPWIWASEHIYYDESHTLLVSGLHLDEPDMTASLPSVVVHLQTNRSLTTLWLENLGMGVPLVERLCADVLAVHPALTDLSLRFVNVLGW